MPESQLETLLPEQDYAKLLGKQGQVFLRLAATLLATGDQAWTKRHFFQTHTEADELESFLDDYGARYNRTYHLFTELVASVRGFAIAGLHMAHLAQRLQGYRVLDSLPPAQSREAVESFKTAQAFIRRTLQTLLEALIAEARALDLEVPAEKVPQDVFAKQPQRFRLPRNLDQEELQDEEQRIAEVSTKYLQACAMLEEASVRGIQDSADREVWLRARCSEEHARVYEATVHNLQSAYDTYIKNTVLEGRDDRLPRLRGHISSCLHLLEVVTQLTHFVERHESGERTDAAERSIARLVEPHEVRDVTLNHLLVWADTLLQAGREIAGELLPTYTNVQSLQVEVDGSLTVHARPASLIVAIVNHYGTPVELVVADQACNAGSILELMIAIGSHPDERRYTINGDERPLRDIKLLFEHQLGENGLDSLPPELDYLRRD